MSTHRPEGRPPSDARPESGRAGRPGAGAVRNETSLERPGRGRGGVAGHTVRRQWTKPGVHPFDEVEWELRSAVITSEKGETVFQQDEVEVPRFWSQMATNIVAQKYFRGTLGTPGRESSVKQLIGRVVETIGRWGRAGRGWPPPPAACT